ncbi:MAG: thiamine phosphate synthase [Acidobacteria bacterium]|nr:thiamine phosphate synthase [Acidobacteriota bacterium]
MTSPVPPASRLGIVSDRRRLAAAAGRPLQEGPALLAEQVAAAAACGLAFFQVREPDLSGAALLTLTQALVATAGGRTRVVVNDRADVAVAGGAALHLRHHSIPAAAVRAWGPPGLWITRAVHAAADVRAAGPVDALIAGTAAPSASKPAGSPTLGPAGLAALVAESRVPVFAIGGLGPAEWPWVAASGAFGMAAIGLFLPRPGESVGAAVRRAVDDALTVID